MIGNAIEMLLLSSGGYFLYRLFLAKERNFALRRYYLLGVLLLSVSLPFVDIDLGNPAIELDVHYFDSGQPVEKMTVISDPQFTKNDRIPKPVLDYYEVLLVFYFLVTGVLGFRFYRNIMNIRRDIWRSDTAEWKGLQVVLLDRIVEPYTFLNRIYVSGNHFRKGQISPMILDHERIHVIQKHSLDILCAEFLKVLFWFNPFYFLIKNEMVLNHEFIADQQVVREYRDSESYLKKLVGERLFAGTSSLISKNSFTHMKKRINMIKKLNASFRFRTGSLIALAVLSGVLTYTACTNQLAVQQPDPDKFVVVLDPGHGGKDPGTHGTESNEKDIVLEFSKRIPKYLNNEEIELVFTRQEDEFVPLQDRVEIANSNNADLLISLHLNAHPGNPEQQGLTAHYSMDNVKAESSKVYAERFAEKLQFPGIKSSVHTNDFWVLKTPESSAVLLNMGYLTNPSDEKNMRDPDFQEALAKRMAETIRTIYRHSSELN